MLNLSSINHLDLEYQDPGMDAKRLLSDVIRSLSSTIVDQSEQYIQKYISLQTFGNDGDESTSETRRFNATATLIQAYKGISVKNTLQSCKEIVQDRSNSVIAFKVGSYRYAFGFNGRDVIYRKDGNLGNDLLTILPSLTISNPNALTFDDRSPAAPIERYYSCCCRLLSTTLQNSGLGSTNEQLYWVIIRDQLVQGENGYFVPAFVVQKDNVNNQLHMLEAKSPHINEADYGKALLAALDGLYRNLFNLQSPISLLYHEYFTHIREADRLTNIGSCYLLQWEDHYTLSLPRIDGTDFILNTKLGREALRWDNLPNDIVQWIQFNS